MKHAIKKLLCLSAAVSTFALAACSTPPPAPTFDSELPWHDAGISGAAYEKLEFSAAAYDTRNGLADDVRVKIADGSLCFELTEDKRTDGDRRYSSLDMSFSLTYNSAAPEADRGKTDAISSSTEFATGSLVTSKMTKTVSLADRDGKENLSYKIDADYFDAHSASIEWRGASSSISIPSGTYYDNETMFYLARATALSPGASTSFYMTGLFDCFLNGGFSSITMTTATDGSIRMFDIGDWVKDFGIEGVTDDNNVTSYPVSCYSTQISMNVEKQGPPYFVLYSEKPFKSGEKEHKKVPVFISYCEYERGKVVRITEYTLTGCSFDKA